MKTLIELYDERAIENVLGPEMFRPEKVIYVCPPEVVEEHLFEETMRHFFRLRGVSLEVEIVESSLYKSDKIYRQLLSIVEKNEDCVLDITGGTDAALFAAGMVCNEKKIPAFTYSRKKNRFYDIRRAEFADRLPCTIEYSVSDFFEMAGGTLRKGRVDNHVLSRYMDTYEPFFKLFLEHRSEWTDFITFMVRISQNHGDEPISLRVNGSYEQKGERGSRVYANVPLLRGIEQIGYIRNLEMTEGETVCFVFTDEQVRFWLRDVGSVLELYMYKKCHETGLFKDVVSSAIVDWDGTNTKDSVSNEIDVVATRGVVPLFISCKACEIKTEAINELALLKDRFGGKGARAAIVTTEHVNASARHRASQLGITVIDIEELERDLADERLEVIMKVRESL